MFKKLSLIAHIFRGWPEWLEINGKQMQVRAIAINTSPYLLTKVGEDGLRAANREELEQFAQQFKPGNILVIHGVDSESIISMFGPISKLYAAKGTEVEHVNQDPIWGVPGGALFLWIKEDPKNTSPAKTV